MRGWYSAGLQLDSHRVIGSRGVHRAVIVIVCEALLAGCMTSPTRSDGAWSTDLDGWIDAELTPYLVEQLTRHPRFKGEAMLLVGTEGANVRSEIDEITRNIRSRLMEALLSTSGINLVWPLAISPWEHQRTQHEVRCGRDGNADYYIGIEVTRATQDNFRVGVRALDIREQTWVPGFGKQWQGKFTPIQQMAYERRSTDEYLRGLRVLPFAESQADMLAAYLANNLSCLLRGYGGGDLTVYAEPAAGAPVPLRTAVSLLGNYLAHMQQVRVTDDLDEADLILHGDAHEIRAGLYQLWVIVRPAQPTHDLPSVATEAYILLSPGVSPATVALDGYPTRDEPVTASDPQSEALLSSIRVMTPRDRGLCRSSDAWRRGKRVLRSTDPVYPGDCFAVEVDLWRSAHVFLLNYPVDGNLVRLLPACDESDRRMRFVTAGDTFRFPVEGAAAPALIVQDGPSGLETFYVVAVIDVQAAIQVERHLRRLPTYCASAGQDSLAGLDLGTWLTELDQIMGRFDDDVAWRAAWVQHAR